MKRWQRGSALPSALALVAISTILLAGACILVVSYLERQRRDADYTDALHLAEAGLSYELRYVSTHRTNSPSVHTAASPYIGSVTGVQGSFSVYTQNVSGSSSWTPRTNVTITSTGTVGGVSRTVRCTAKGYNSLFPSNTTYAIFGYQSVTFAGSSSAVNGNLGTNALVTASNGGGGSINGFVVLNGIGATLSGTITSQGVVRNSTTVPFPTIDNIVAQLFGGWSYLSAQPQLAAQAARIRKYVTNTPVLTPSGTTSANWTSSVTDLTNSNVGGLPVSTMILTPGDYYFTSAQLSGQTKIVCDTGAVTLTNGTPGPVRIWFGGAGTQQDTMNIDVSFTSTDPRYFRLFYNKPSTLSLGGNLTYFGGIYAVRAGSNSSVTPATVSFSGGAKTNGSVVCDVAKISGGSILTYPSSGVAYDGDYVDKYGFLNQWQEIAGTRARTFTDGTNR